MKKQNYKRILTLMLLRRARKQNRRRFWVHPMFQQRKIKGEFYTTFQEMKENIHKIEYQEKFRSYLRMSFEAFSKLLNFVKR
jgi:hypothetical protein